MNPEAATLGVTLRRVRIERGLSQTELARLAGAAVSHISRIETGQRLELSRDLLGRLGAALNAVDELAVAAGRLTREMEMSVAPYARALSGDLLRRTTLPALRCLDALGRAESAAGQLRGGELGNRVDPVAICRILGLKPLIGTQVGSPPLALYESGRAVITVAASGDGSEREAQLPRVRFLQAHAAAHAILGRRDGCSLPKMTDLEIQLCDVAAALLAPRRLLEAAVMSAGLETADMWTGEVGRLVTEVAASLGIPGWVAIRRLADERLLDDQGLYVSMTGGTIS